MTFSRTTVENMILAVLDMLLQRGARDPGYPFIDTKIDVLAGRDFSDADPWYCRRDVVYAWVQGRGLEALCRHAEWLDTLASLSSAARGERIGSIKRIVRAVASRMEAIRARYHGRLPFMFTPDGTCLTLDAHGQKHVIDAPPPAPGYSDLFYAKGLLAAGLLLEDEACRQTGAACLRGVIQAVLDDVFVSDQIAFNPAARTAPDPRRRPLGPPMIALGGTALALRARVESEWEDLACALLARITQRHLRADADDGLSAYDCCEAVDETGAPWVENGRILGDPGHALEFAGLAVANALLLPPATCGAWRTWARSFLPPFIRHQFALGFRPNAGGIVKSVDLLDRDPIDANMPWWSLPEAARAAALTAVLAGDESLWTLAETCIAGYAERYVNGNRHGLPFQTLGPDGRPARVIPAVPDADPGYHTGLSLIDVLAVSRV